MATTMLARVSRLVLRISTICSPSIWLTSREHRVRTYLTQSIPLAISSPPLYITRIVLLYHRPVNATKEAQSYTHIWSISDISVQLPRPTECRVASIVHPSRNLQESCLTHTYGAICYVLWHSRPEACVPYCCFPFRACVYVYVLTPSFYSH